MWSRLSITSTWCPARVASSLAITEPAYPAPTTRVSYASMPSDLYPSPPGEDPAHGVLKGRLHGVGATGRRRRPEQNGGGADPASGLDVGDGVAHEDGFVELADPVL